MDEIIPLSATKDSVMISNDDFQRLISRAGRGLDPDDPEVPNRWDNDTAYRVIENEVYEVLHDSMGNPYIKRRGVLVNHE